MYGLPRSEVEALNALQLWGRNLGYGGPASLPKSAVFLPKARGIDCGWRCDDDEVAGLVVTVCLDDDERLVVSRYFQLLLDDRVDGSQEWCQCNMTLVLWSFEKAGIVVRKRDAQRLIDAAVNRVRMALSYPSLIEDVRKDAVLKAA
jgi:hypothetical protein